MASLIRALACVPNNRSKQEEREREKKLWRTNANPSSCQIGRRAEQGLFLQSNHQVPACASQGRLVDFDLPVSLTRSDGTLYKNTRILALGRRCRLLVL
jgi:hypothetical protein